MDIYNIITKEIKSFLDKIIAVRGPSFIPNKFRFIKNNLGKISIFALLLLVVSLNFYGGMNFVPQAISNEIFEISMIPIFSWLIISVYMYERDRNPIKLIIFVLTGVFFILSVAHLTAAAGFDMSGAPPEIYAYDRSYWSYSSYEEKYRLSGIKLLVTSIIGALFWCYLSFYEKKKAKRKEYCMFCGAELPWDFKICSKCGKPNMNKKTL